MPRLGSRARRRDRRPADHYIVLVEHDRLAGGYRPLWVVEPNQQAITVEGDGGRGRFGSAIPYLGGHFRRRVELVPRYQVDVLGHQFVGEKVLIVADDYRVLAGVNPYDVPGLRPWQPQAPALP